MTKIIVAFRSFPNALNKNITYSFPRSACLTRLAKKQARGCGLVFSTIIPVNHQPKLSSRSFSGGHSVARPSLLSPQCSGTSEDLPVFQTLTQDAWAFRFLFFFLKGRFIALISTQHTSRVTKLFHCNNQFTTVFWQFNMDNCGAARFQQWKLGTQ